MEDRCQCGQRMEIELRTLVYQGQVEIKNVPVASCRACGRTQVLEEVKPELKALLKELGERPGSQLVAFQDVSAFTQELVEAAGASHHIPEDWRDAWRRMKIDELLDLLILARSLQDEQWVEEIREALRAWSESFFH
ncbi:MAG: hypothetical protein A6D91_03670 [Bacillaceae bacterium G1]|nr:MAG: hypothetical protein A6D91_03670 [Bacillaceae bacterium G1]